MTDAADGPAFPHLYELKLFVAGGTVLSQQAIRNLRRICDAHLPGQVEMEVVDIYQQPERAELEQLIAAPTLVKKRPGLVRRLVGDLSDTRRVLALAISARLNAPIPETPRFGVFRM